VFFILVKTVYSPPLAGVLDPTNTPGVTQGLCSTHTHVTYYHMCFSLRKDTKIEKPCLNQVLIILEGIS
jgi:hypothetical protein